MRFYINKQAGAQALAPKQQKIMEKKKEEKERVRKAYAPKGQRTQKMMSFRVDNDLEEWLNQQPNKGRYINDLIMADWERHRGNEE